MMKFSKKFKVIWWIIISLFVLILLIFRSDEILFSNPTFLDIALISVFLALLLLPLYSEISLFGMSIKQKVEEANKEIKQHFNNQMMSFLNQSLRVLFLILINLLNTSIPVSLRRIRYYKLNWKMQNQHEKHGCLVKRKLIIEKIRI